MIKDEDSNLRKIERGLYTTDIQPPARRSILHDGLVDAPEEWQSPTAASSAQPMKRSIIPTSLFRNIFLGSVVFLVVAIGILAYSFLNGGNSISANNVDITITTQSFVDGGDSLPVDVSILNKNKLPLQLVTLDLEYPDGSTDDPTAVTRIEHSINSIAAGDTDDESFTVQLYGQQNSQQTLTAHLEFRVQGSNVIYDKDEPATVTIRTSPANMTLNVPTSVSPNQQVPLTFTITGNGTATLPNTAMVLQYPADFTFAKATPAPTFGSTVWYIGDLPPGASKTITVYGSFAGSATNLDTVQASVGAQDQSNEQLLDTTYATLTQVVTLTSAFLAADLTVNGQASSPVAISSHGQVSVGVSWTNTLSTPVTNAEIIVHLSGVAYDPGSVSARTGYFDSNTNEVTWDSQDDPSLATIAPGGTGTETFTLTPLQFSGTSVPTNQTITLSVDVVGYGSGGNKITAQNVDTSTMLVTTNLNMFANAEHYTGAITNTGPMPPVAGKETTYTVELQIDNLMNHVSNVVVQTTLPSYVTWKNVAVPASQAANLTYNTVTRQVTWNAGDIPAGTGGSLPATTVSFQIGITPSTSQVGQQPQLTGQITLTGEDTFTNTPISLTKRELYTQLLNDGNGIGDDGTVSAN